MFIEGRSMHIMGAFPYLWGFCEKVGIHPFIIEEWENTCLEKMDFILSQYFRFSSLFVFEVREERFNKYLSLNDEVTVELLTKYLDFFNVFINRDIDLSKLTIDNIEEVIDNIKIKLKEIEWQIS